MITEDQGICVINLHTESGIDMLQCGLDLDNSSRLLKKVPILPEILCMVL